MKTTRTAYLIFVRPPGSHMWTQHAPQGIPFARYDKDQAEAEAISITESTKFCTRVVTVDHPIGIDGRLYAQMSDGDIRYYPAEP